MHPLQCDCKLCILATLLCGSFTHGYSLHHAVRMVSHMFCHKLFWVIVARNSPDSVHTYVSYSMLLTDGLFALQ